jgi:hypothetical protein
LSSEHQDSLETGAPLFRLGDRPTKAGRRVAGVVLLLVGLGVLWIATLPESENVFVATSLGGVFCALGVVIFFSQRALWLEANGTEIVWGWNCYDNVVSLEQIRLVEASLMTPLEGDDPWIHLHLKDGGRKEPGRGHLFKDDVRDLCMFLARRGVSVTLDGKNVSTSEP